MKTSKKLLIVAISLFFTSIISACLALGAITFFGASFWYAFWFFNALQIGGSVAWDKFYESRNTVRILEEHAKEFANKPFRKYLIPLQCSHCSHTNEIEIDLNDTEFRCEGCKKYNGVHVNFTTAAITEPINQIL